MKRKSMKDGMLRAAVALSLLGAMAIPAEIGALEPRRDKYMSCFYEGTFDWSNVSSTPIDVSIGGVWGYGSNFIDIRLRSGFCASNGTVGKKQIAYLFNTNYRRPYLETDRYRDYDNYSNEWEKVNGNSNQRKRTASDEISQNGAKLRNTQEHWITLEGNNDDYSYNLYYEIKEASDSSLNFDDNAFTWKTGDTFITLGRKFDFGTSGLSINLDSLKIKNQDAIKDIKLGDSMTLINDGGYYDYTAFYDKVKPSLHKTKGFDYKGNFTNSITASGILNTQTGITTSNGKNALTLNAQSYTLNTVDLDLSKIGNGGDAWKNGEKLYSNSKINPGPLTITVKNALAGGTTDGNYKVGDTMTLLNLSGWYNGTITTKYGDETIADSKSLDVDFSDASASGVAVTGKHTDTLRKRQWRTGFLGMNYNYTLDYTIGQKDVEGVSASTIDLSKEGFTADSGYTIGRDLTLDFSQTTFTNLANVESNKSYTLLNFTDATWKNGGKLSFKDSTSSTVTKTSNEYVETEATNGVTALGTKDITFTLDNAGKKVDVSASDAHVSKIQLGAFDINQGAQTIGNLVSGGTIDASGLSIKGMSLQEAADSTKALTLAKSEGNTTFTGWSASSTTPGYAVYDDGHGTTGTLAGTFDTTDGNINLKADGLQTIAFKEINFIDWTGVTLTSGKLRSVDVSNIYNFWTYYFGFDGTRRLLDAKNLSNENIDLVGVSSTWTKHTLTVGDTTLTTYQSPLTQKTESVSAAGMTLSLRQAEQYTTTETKTNDGKYNFSVDFTTRKKIATGFSKEKITWKKDEGDKSYGLVLKEDYDFTALADGAISFDASDPYKLIANPDQVGLNETMTFFDAGKHMTKAEWNKKVAVVSSGSAKTYEATDRAVTVQGSVKLDITKDDENQKVFGTVSEEYLSGVKIDLSQIGAEETAKKNKWENGKILYSVKQDYDGTDGKKTAVEISGTTDESVKAGESMTLVHIEGKDAGVAGNITAFNEKRDVSFQDTATNGMVAKGTHQDTLKSTVSGETGQGTYELTYEVGKKAVTGLNTTNLDLTKDAFKAGDQYTLAKDLTVDVSQLIVGETGSATTPKAIIDFSDDKTGSGNLLLSGGTSGDDGKVTSAITYTETDADAVNGVKAGSKQNRTFSTTGKVVYVDSVTKETDKVIIGDVDLSKDARSFHDLSAEGTINVKDASYNYSENKKISDVTGQTIQVAGVTAGNTFNNGKWTGLSKDTIATIAVTQETGISGVVNATYDTSDGNINLKTDGLASLTFGEGIAWSKDTTAVSLSEQDVSTVDFSKISFADTETKKNETMHLLNVQGMTQKISTVNAPASGWVARTDTKTGTTYYNKDGRTHDDADNLTGNGITLTVDRGDRIAMKTETKDGKTNTTLDYTRGQGYVTGMSIASDGITWENGKTAIQLGEDYDFYDTKLTFPADKLTVSNASTLKSGDNMTLFDANGHMSDSDWTDMVKIDPTSKTVGEYTNKESDSVTITGKIGIDLSKEDSQKVVATVTEQYMTDIKVDLSKVTTTDNGSKARNARAALCSNSTSEQDYDTYKVNVSVDNEDEIFGGTTDETVKAKDTVTLLDITGTHAAGEGNITAINLTNTMAFRDKQENGLTVTGTHTDTIRSEVSSIDATTSNYQLIYTVGTKELNAGSEISAVELDMTKDAFTAEGQGQDQYKLTGDVTIDVRNIKIKNIGDGVKKAFIDFSSGDTGSGKFILKYDDQEEESDDSAGVTNSNSVTNTVSYTEDTEINGIWAAGNQTRQFSVSDDGKIVYLDSVSQDVNQVTIGMVDVSKPLRSFSNLAKEGTISIISSISEDGTTSEGNVILDNLALTKDWGTNFTIAEAEGENTFSDWTLPTDLKDVYCRQETGVVGIMEGKFNAGKTEAEKGNLMIQMEGIKSIYFADDVKWGNGRTVLDFAGSGVDFTGKSIDASQLSFDAASVDSLVTTDGAYQMILINTDADNHLDKAEIKNKTDIKMTIADTITFKGETKLSADKLQFVADMWKGTGTATDSAHRHVMAQAASSQAIVSGNVDATDSISRALSHYHADTKDENSMIFAGIGGSNTRTETGSHISQHLWNVNAGVGTQKDLANGAHTEYGLYYEGGTGTYNTKGAGNGIASTKGDLKHHGAGFLFRYENKNHVYGEAGAHVGRVKNKNQALGLNDSATYYGFHLGIGKIIETNDKDSWDLYTKFYWNRTGGLDYKNSAITEIGLDSVNSKLLRIGGRYNHQTVNDWSFYVGAAFAYEFGGSANGAAGIVNGDFANIRTATTKGAGALLEIGLRKEAANGSPWDIDLGLKGYLGRQKGIGGNIGVNYHF